MIGKKARGEGASISVVLIVIALFMVLYIIFLPVEDRRNLLDLNQSDTTSSGSTTTEKIELLAESPGTISPTKEFGVKHTLPEVNLFIKTEPEVNKLAANLAIKKGLFVKSSPLLRFKAGEIKDTNDVILSFYVQKASGELRIKLNGNIIYSETINSPGSKVVDINKNLLSSENELEFSVSSGIFSVNEYNLQDITFKQEFERINSKEERTLTLTEGEFKTISSAKLIYTQVCNGQLSHDTTAFDIHINEFRVSSQNIKCVTTNQEIEIDTQYLRNGKNIITFTLEEGDFSFSQIDVETKSSDTKFLTYQFSVPLSEFKDIEAGNKKVNIEFLMSQEKRKKNANLVINNDEILLNTDSAEFSRDISDFIVQGTNFVRIIPSNTFLVNSIKVTLEDS